MVRLAAILRLGSTFHTFRRLGGTRTISADLRFIAATNVDLERALEGRRFRSDLYYRLNGVQIQLPPLRERAEDIQPLAHHLLGHFNGVYGRQVRGIHPSAQRLLDTHSWPGNVRELRNVMERAVLVETSSLITTVSVALRNRDPVPKLEVGAIENGFRPARFSLHQGQRELITAALGETGGNQSRAAALLGIGRFSLRYKMKKLGLLRSLPPEANPCPRSVAQAWSAELSGPQQTQGLPGAAGSSTCKIWLARTSFSTWRIPLGQRISSV